MSAYDNIALTLPRREAAVLRALCGWVEGSLEGPRGTFENIANQLDAQGAGYAILVFRRAKVECVAAWPAKGGAA